MKTVKVGIKGTTPILFNRFTEENEKAVAAGHGPSMKNKKQMTPEEAAKKTAYMDSKGNLVFPGTNLFACLVAGGKFFKHGRKTVTTNDTSLVPGAVAIKEHELSFRRKKFAVDSRRVRNPVTKGAVMKHRARLDEWRLDFTLEVDEGFFDLDLVRDIVEAAGKRIGIGDFRPQRKGLFGKFEIDKWDVKE
jgi:hypothetical protein